MLDLPWRNLERQICLTTKEERGNDRRGGGGRLTHVEMAEGYVTAKKLSSVKCKRAVSATHTVVARLL